MQTEKKEVQEEANGEDVKRKSIGRRLLDKLKNKKNRGKKEWYRDKKIFEKIRDITDKNVEYLKDF